MCDLIHFGDLLYAWGESCLGDFLAVQSNRGLVAFEFASADGNAIKQLQARFPECRFDGTARGHGGDDRSARPPGRSSRPGSEDRARYPWHRLREESLGAAAANPAGGETRYGAVAAQMGTRDARDVTTAIANNILAILIPCHRVVKKDGSLSGYRWGSTRKRALLERERKKN